MSYTRGQLIGNGANGVLGSILARLERLERQHQGPSETLVPNTYRVDPSGNVIVSGIILPESVSSALSVGHAIQWQDSGGNTREFVQGSAIGGGHELDILVQADAGTNPNNGAEITVRSEPANAQQIITLSTSWGPGNSDPALLQVTSHDDAAGRDSVRVQAKANSRTIIDDLGESSFLQIVNALQKLRIDIGGFVNVPGTSTTTVSHSLGVVPQRFALTMQTSAGVNPGPLSVQAGSATTTQFTIQNTGPNSTDCYWLAFG